MWFLSEIETEIKLRKLKEQLSEIEIYKRCIKSSIEPKLKFGSNGRCLGWAIEQDECSVLFGF